MINKFITTILLTTCLTTSALAQNIKIKVDNSEPRLGQEINLTIETDFIEEFLKGVLTDSLELIKTFSNKDLTKTIVARQLGTMTIGPIQFDFNGKNYQSNSITINVIPNLPDKEGVWIRKLILDNIEYILIEQISILKPVTSSSANSWNIEWKATEENLVKLIQEPYGEDIKFLDRRSGRGAHPDSDKDYSPSISYSYNFYEIKKGEGFKGEFKLKKKHFENLPKGTEIPVIIID